MGPGSAAQLLGLPLPTLSFRLETDSRCSGYARSAKASRPWICKSYSPSLSAVNEGWVPSTKSYCQWRLYVTAPIGFSTTALEPEGRSFTVHVYSMAAPLRLANSGRSTFSPAFRLSLPPPETVKG